MPYVLPNTAIPNFRKIDKDYEEKAQVKLNAEPTKLAIWTGWAKNTPERKVEVDFILFWINYFNLNDDINKNELSSLRFFLVSCLFIQFKTKKGNLKNLTDKYLALDQQSVDENTSFLSIMEAKKFITSTSIDNWVYTKNKDDEVEIIKPSIQLSKEFISYIETEFLNIEENFTHSTSILDSLPITDALMEIGSKVGEAGGLSFGIVAGVILAQTASGVPICAYIVKGVNEGFHLIVKASTANILTYFLGQTLSESLLKVFSAVTLGYILKELGGLLGKAAVIPPGLALDAMIKVVESVSNAIYHYLYPVQPLDFEGRLLTDGSFFKPEKRKPQGALTSSELTPLNADNPCIN